MQSSLGIMILFGILLCTNAAPRPEEDPVPKNSYHNSEGVKVFIPSPEATTDIITTTYPSTDEGVTGTEQIEDINRNSVNSLTTGNGNNLGKKPSVVPSSPSDIVTKQTTTTSLPEKTTTTTFSPKHGQGVSHSNGNTIGLSISIPKVPSISNLFGR